MLTFMTVRELYEMACSGVTRALKARVRRLQDPG